MSGVLRRVGQRFVDGSHFQTHGTSAGRRVRRLPDGIPGNGGLLPEGMWALRRRAPCRQGNPYPGGAMETIRMADDGEDRGEEVDAAA